MSDEQWVEIPESMLAQVMELVATVGNPDTVTVPLALVDSLIEFLSEDLGCNTVGQCLRVRRRPGQPKVRVLQRFWHGVLQGSNAG